MGPTMTRLLKEAAKTFKDGSHPFCWDWLSGNKVTPAQCMSMSDIIGAVIEWFVDQDPNTQAQVLLHGFHPELTAELAAEGQVVDREVKEGKRVRVEVRQFALLMEQQLVKNDYKGGWQGESPRQLYIRIIDELAELLDALGKSAEHVGRETADVANFAMMIADAAGCLKKVSADALDDNIVHSGQ